MGTISRSGITGGGTIQAVHVTNIIDALDGTSTTTTVVATGSFSGSLVGALTGTASFATSALSASYAANVPLTASYALNAMSSSYALTASYAINGGSGGGGIFALTGSVYSTTNNLNITGSLRVTAGVTASLLGTASYAAEVAVVRTSDNATFYSTFVDSSNPTTGSEQLYTAAAITITPSRGLFQATSISGSITGSILAQGSLMTSNGTTTTLSGSLTGTVDASTNLILNLADLGKSAGRGYFVMPKQIPTYYTIGTMYVDMVDPPVLKVWDGSNWRTLTFT